MTNLNFSYEGQEIDFVPVGTTEVMVNATEMAKAFGKRTEDFMKTSNTKSFIEVMEKQIILPLNGGRIIENRGRNGLYFHRLLALKFAAWLSPEFELWVFKTIDEFLYGSYITWRNAQKAKLETEQLLEKKKQYLAEQYPEFREYFETEIALNQSKNKVTAAMHQARKQLTIEFYETANEVNK